MLTAIMCCSNYINLMTLLATPPPLHVTISQPLSKKNNKNIKLFNINLSPKVKTVLYIILWRGAVYFIAVRAA